MNFSDLPIELKVLIFSYINQSDLFCKVSYVCKEWKQIARDPTLFKNVKLNGSIDNESKISKVLSHATLVRCLEFRYIDDWSWMKKLSVQYNLLTSIEFYSCTLTSNDMAEIVFRFPTIKCFETSCSELDEDWLKHVSNWKKLKNFYIRFRPSFSEERNKFTKIDANYSLLQIGMQCEFLESFHLIDYFNINDDFMETFIHYRKGTLKKFSLMCNKLTGRGFKSISDGYLINELAIYDPSNTKHLCTALKKMTQLERLLIHGDERTSFFEGDFRLLFREKKFPKLFEIIISECPNFDHLAMSLMIKNCPALKKLQLHNTVGILDYALDTVNTDCKNLESFEFNYKTRLATGFLHQRFFYWSKHHKCDFDTVTDVL